MRRSIVLDNRLWIAAPLTILLIWFGPTRIVYVPESFAGGDRCAGIPFIWKCDDVNSLEFTGYIGPFLIFAGLCAAIAFATVLAWLWLTVRLPKFVSGGVTIVVWCSGFAFGLMLATVLVSLGSWRDFWHPADLWEQVRAVRWRW